MNTAPGYDKVVAITGTIGSGKSSVARIIDKLGYRVIDADQIARKLLDSDSKVQADVCRVFPEVHDPALPTVVDRKLLANIAFADPHKRAALEAILHPRIRMQVDELVQDHLNTSTSLLFYDCPLLFETGLDRLGFKAIIVVTASEETCIARATLRLKLSAEKVKRRMNQQLPQATKIAKADFVIDNSGSLTELEEKVRATLNKLIEV